MASPAEEAVGPIPTPPAGGGSEKSTTTLSTTVKTPTLDPEFQKRFDEQERKLQGLVTEMEGLYAERGEIAKRLETERGDILKRFLDQPQQKQPPDPKDPKYAAPSQPSRAIRPFLEGGPGDSGDQLMQRITMGLGTLAQMATGVMLKYPEGALAAWTGALQGWAEGDAVRADREFENWKAAVKRGRDAFADDLAGWHALREKHKDNWEQLKTEMAIRDAKAGASKEKIDMSLKSPELRWKELDAQNDMWDKMYSHTTQATLKLMAEQSRKDQLRFMDDLRVWDRKYKMMKHDSDSSFRQAALNMTGATKLGGMINQADKFVTAIDKIDLAYQNIVKKMGEKGQAHLIPKGATRFDQWAAQIGRYLEPNDPDLVLIRGQWPEVVVGLYSRGWADEKGARTIAAFAPQLHIGEQLPPPEAWDKYVKFMRTQVQRSAMKRYEEMEATGALDPKMLQFYQGMVQGMQEPEDNADVDRLMNLFKTPAP